MKKYQRLFLTLILFNNFLPALADIEQFSPDYTGEDFIQVPQDIGSLFNNTKHDPPQKRIELFTNKLREYPENSSLLEGRALVYANNNQLTEAITDLSEAINKKPERSSYYWERAQIYEQQKNFNLALADCNVARRLAPGFTRWTSDWLKAKIFLAEDDKSNSRLAAKKALYSMSNFGVGENSYTSELRALAGREDFKPVVENNAATLKQIQKIAELKNPPNENDLQTILGFTQSTSTPGNCTYVIEPENSNWLSYCVDKTSSASRKELQLNLDLDAQKIDESALKAKFATIDDPSASGPEHILTAKNDHCKITFVLQPKGLKGLSSVRLSWL